MKESALSLPVVPASPHLSGDSEGSDGLSWNGLKPAAPQMAHLSPEPDTAQGEYAEAAEAPLQFPAFERSAAFRPVELLAPAGGPDSAYAAFHYGADAIYLGLKKFSARAEAENFTLDDVAEVTAYAHSLTPRRRVFVTVNTLIRQDELQELVENLRQLAAIGVDALIIQDLGVFYIARKHFPELELHASTQLAVHNRAGAATLRRLGFKRVVLARELTLEEVRDITVTSGVETEVFIHGALCYSYSGLCLFSSQTLGRSGNRGKCAYSCRDSFEVDGAPDRLRDGTPVKRHPGRGFPFSMKDLALPDFLPVLRASGVSCFKIEGRKKSPLYVATTTDYYRKLLDGRLDSHALILQEADLQTVFSRPWTRLFVQSHKDKEVADRDTVGHRGTPIGRVESIRNAGSSSPRLRFCTQRRLERHDGLQIDLPILGKPFGFAVDRMWVAPQTYFPAGQGGMGGEPGGGGKSSAVFEAPAGSLVEVELPRHHPPLPAGALVYCSSSQAVKRQYRHARPKPGLFRVRTSVDIDAEITPMGLDVVARVSSLWLGGLPIAVRRSLPGPFEPAEDGKALAAAARSAFAKLGDSHLSLQSFHFRNKPNAFVPISRLNRLRRKVIAELEEAIGDALSSRRASVWADIRSPSNLLTCQASWQGETSRHGSCCAFRWSIKVDRVGYLDAFQPDDWAGLDEVIVDIARDHPILLMDHLQRLAGLLGRERIRLALPALTRKWEEAGLLFKVHQLRAAGWAKWEAANLSAWSLLGVDPSRSQTQELDLATDWSIYTLNRAAARQFQQMGATRFVLSPEDGLDNVRSILTEFGSKAVLIAYQDTPLFMAESCAYANLIGGCPGKTNCRFESMEMISQHGEKVTALDYHCRTIVLNKGPFCLSTRLKDLAKAGAVSLRADFIYRKYEPDQVCALWRKIRAGQPVPSGQAANFDRGLL